MHIVTTRDVLRWNFAPWDMLLIAGIALAGCATGMLDFASERIERWMDETLAGMPDDYETGRGGQGRANGRDS